MTTRTRRTQTAETGDSSSLMSLMSFRSLSSASFTSAFHLPRRRKHLPAQRHQPPLRTRRFKDRLIFFRRADILAHLQPATLLIDLEKIPVVRSEINAPRTAEGEARSDVRAPQGSEGGDVLRSFALDLESGRDAAHLLVRRPEPPGLALEGVA